MTEDDYIVRDCTALLDAIGGAIHHIGNIHKWSARQSRQSGAAHRSAPGGNNELMRIISAGRKAKVKDKKICAALGVSLSQFFAKGAVQPDLTAEQAEIVETWNGLRPEERERLMKIVRTFQ